jgi:cobalt-zinc-cadmium efflux system outer membrane protein
MEELPMFNLKIPSFILSTLLSLAIVGCTVHPTGEHEERDAAQTAGKPFEKPIEDRELPQLPHNPSPDQLVQYALLSNAELEQRYWEWRAAIEQIPQDGTQTSTLNIAAGTTITRGRDSLSASTLALSNDPMTDIKWPSKLDAAAQQAMENARAAGRRFRKAQFELRAQVLEADYDYALNAELIRLEQSDHQLLKTILSVTQTRSGAGLASQQDILKAATELDLSANGIANMQSQLPAERAAINALLSRAPQASLAPPTELPRVDCIPYSDDDLITLAARQNPELRALADQIKAQKQGIRLAQLQFIPDFNLSVGTDLMGISQSLLGQATIPIFRYEAIEAAIAQAQANLNAAEAMHRQATNDLNAQIILDITTFHDAQRQVDLISDSILPRLERMIDVDQTGYESGQASLLDLLDSRRSLIEIERLAGNLRVTQAKRRADLEAIICVPLTPTDD